MNTAVATQSASTVLEQVVVGGDLSKLQPKERMEYYAAVCNSVGLNPLTRPFEYITLNGKLTLYAKRDATDQLRSIKGISIQIVGRELVGEIYIVTARASIGGREDEATGAVNIASLRGEALANAYMKAETKAKRRVTLSIAGLGLLDETEIEDATSDMPHSGAPVVQMPRAIEKTADTVEADPTDKPASNGKTINATQQRIIRNKCGDPDVEEAVCSELGVKSLAEIPAEKVNDAIALAEKASGK